MQEWAEQGFQTDATMQDMRALIDKAATPDDPPGKVSGEMIPCRMTGVT